MNKQQASVLARRVEVHLRREEFDDAVAIVRHAEREQRQAERTLESMTYEQRLDLPLPSVDGIPPRVVEALDRSSIYTVRDALAVDLSSLHCIGDLSRSQIQSAIDKVL